MRRRRLSAGEISEMRRFHLGETSEHAGVPMPYLGLDSLVGPVEHDLQLRDALAVVFYPTSRTVHESHGVRGLRDQHVGAVQTGNPL